MQSLPLWILPCPPFPPFFFPPLQVEADLAAFFKKYPGIDTVARMSTINSFLKHAFPYMHFVGFYTVMEDGKRLQIGPYNGMVLATAIIAFGRGQCGYCASIQKTVIAEDVATCGNYIPCDDVTRSEIVLPVFGLNKHNEADAVVDGAAGAGAAGEGAAAAAPSKKLIAVLDIDSDVLAAFDAQDQERLERILQTYF